MNRSYLRFVPSTPPRTSSGDATAHHICYPRATRKTLRLHIPVTSRQTQTHDGVDSYMRTEYRTDAVHTQNLEFLDRPFDFDEFCDVDNEYDGLTITEPMDEAELFRFCTGYDVI